eukprot:TRINITY_DN80748_c0_g1_i1.p2 TRINITY_DN80748_c0_g1~~TRINITY_DN80748_c0_g1_i1.p2  ORF type:complete len:266 (-),score=50.37 TRINITY_DN80748_c0_g1_i1:60-857(-)
MSMSSFRQVPVGSTSRDIQLLGVECLPRKGLAGVEPPPRGTLTKSQSLQSIQALRLGHHSDVDGMMHRRQTGVGEVQRQRSARFWHEEPGSPCVEAAEYGKQKPPGYIPRRRPSTAASPGGARQQRYNMVQRAGYCQGEAQTLCRRASSPRLGASAAAATSPCSVATTLQRVGSSKILFAEDMLPGKEASLLDDADASTATPAGSCSASPVGSYVRRGSSGASSGGTSDVLEMVEGVMAQQLAMLYKARMRELYVSSAVESRRYL